MSQKPVLIERRLKSWSFEYNFNWSKPCSNSLNLASGFENVNFKNKNVESLGIFQALSNSHEIKKNISKVGICLKKIYPYIHDNVLSTVQYSTVHTL